MLKLILVLAASAALFAQEKPAQPQVRINMLNVCTPTDADKNEIAAALNTVPPAPKFAADYEVARGRTTNSKGVVSEWVRMRRDFAAGAPFSNVQFLLSIEGDNVDETLVLHTRENKPGEPMQISFTNQVTANDATQVLATDTPPSRIRVERFGKASLVLARCPQVDQTAFQPLFRRAADLFARYRAALEVRATVTGELARMKDSRKLTARPIVRHPK